MKSVNVVCVNWGTKYSPDYVERLYKMVKINTTLPFKMYCLTDNPDIYRDHIIGVKLEPGFEGWWNKMQLFKDEVLPPGEYLYFDLDVVIVGDIDCIFEYEGFGITRDFINPDIGLLGGKEYNSSVMIFTQNSAIWAHFINNQTRWAAEQKRIPFFGDQNVISDFLNRNGFDCPFPDEWIWSFKMGSIRGRRPVDHTKFFGAEIPEGGKICVFHGQPNPHQVNIDCVNKHWKNQVSESARISDQEREAIEFQKLDIHVEKIFDNTEISINGMKFTIPNHWFWSEFSASWEPQTAKFFKTNLLPGTDYLDIGAWVGPTALIATALGANRLKLIEPNPLNFFNLVITQLSNNLFSKWFLINACVAKERGTSIIGPLDGIMNLSSATNIRDQNQDGVKIISLKLADLISDDDNFSLIKIDIEGAEDYIIEDLSIFSRKQSAIWLSLHPPFIPDVERFLEKLLSLGDVFYFVDEDNTLIDGKVLESWIKTDAEFPSWGTKWGNFFEIGLLPKKWFGRDGKRKES